ncbi:DNA polymerase [Duganella sp. 1224]|uniref:uracil-DNA glycosylase family protein n=1 Tax=Duganella sp. 1224 TaxID=2587052 RepID=UPI0017A3EA5F|nr:uracil-DNA glycosylase family protein [Duganella sp. 1224]NYE60859.1 DNA polymerase [Duganella sp. 1224]
MSQSATRSAAFLQEMGIGVQWKVRHGAPEAPEADAFVTAVQALADGLPAEDAPVDVAPVARPTPQASAPVAGSRPMSQASAPAPVAVTSAAPAGVPVVARAAPPAAPPAAPAAASSDTDAAGEDMSWFDNAPVPAPAPRAATATASGAAPRPAPPPGRPAQRAATPADAEPPAEDTAWFDDAPMPPPAAPARLSDTSRPSDTPRPDARSSRPPEALHPAAAPSREAQRASLAALEPVSDEAIAAMDWPALQAAVSSCTRCSLCETRVAAVNGRGAENAAWIAIAGMPSQADEQDVQAVTGEAGQLLHNMLKAIELTPDTEVYVTNVVKCRPPGRNPTGEEVIACRPYLERELALTGATMAITFGQFAARGLMMGPAARGQVMHYGASRLPVVATYHPDDLLRKPEDKAKAWADLCLAKASHG